MKPKALIYCRVSSERQVKEGHGLDSQEKRCKDRADAKGYPFVAAFRDEGVSGGLLERPGMKALLAYLDDHPTEHFVVLIDDLSRLARDVTVHLRLRLELKARGAELECLNLDLDKTEEGEFVELVMAGTNQLFRKQNRRQVIQKMKARMEMGCWPLCLPPGLKYVKTEAYGKVPMPDEPLASIFKEAIEGYRDGLLLTLDEVRRFILDKYKVYGVARRLSLRGVNDILTKFLYTGLVKYEPWGVTLREGKGKGFITLETYEIVQEILAGKRKPRLRNDYNADFPARGVVACAGCGRPLTASWNTGRNKRYPNYWCKTAGCQYRYKTIAKGTLEGEFATLLKSEELPAGAFDLAADVLLDVWGQKKQEGMAVREQKLKQEAEYDGLLTNLTARVAKTADDGLVANYEKEIKTLLDKKTALGDGAKVQRYTDEQFGTASRRVMDTLKDPLGMWNSDEYEDKRVVAEMYFDERPKYDYVSGFGTASLALPIAIIHDSGGQKERLVEMEGVEPSCE